MLTPQQLLQAAIEANRGQMPIRGVCYLRRNGMLSAIHVTGRPSVTWCPNCQKIIIRGKGRWWQ